MTNTLIKRQAASAENFHESTHMRSVSNTTDAGEKVVEVRISALSMRWQGGNLQVVHRLTASPRMGALKTATVRSPRTQR